MVLTEERNRVLLTKIEDDIPPTVHLLSHISDLIRDCLNAHLALSDAKEPMKHHQIHDIFGHLNSASKSARKILVSQNLKTYKDPFLDFLTDFQESHFLFDPLPSITELENLYDKMMLFIATNT